MALFINADDFGLSDGANRRILDAFDKQVLHGASLLPNGSAFDAAVREYRKRPGFVLSVHLNLIEGRPLSNPKDVPLLLDAKGYLNCSFGKLITLYLFATRKRRKALLEQIGIEIRAQLAKVKAILHPKAPLRVDSHTHTHMLPFVFRTLAGLAKTMDISYIRVPNEQFFFFTGHVSFWKVYFGTGLIKLFLLKYLSGGSGQNLPQPRHQNMRPLRRSPLHWLHNARSRQGRTQKNFAPSSHGSAFSPWAARRPRKADVERTRTIPLLLLQRLARKRV